MTDDFATDGLLAQVIKGFKPRQAQQQMALAVQQAIEADNVLVVEAGTGTGKTFAYLAPALRCGKKVIISTGSKALQDQLFNRDLPMVAQALNYKGKRALLKGRANYLCLERLNQQLAQGGDLPAQSWHAVMKLRNWSGETDDGDISTCDQVAEDSALWPLVTSTNDNCPGSECPEYKNCFVVKARKRALDAQIVVVNHHLFLADMVIKETGFAELIPATDVTIFDEAHQLPDIASQYFGESLTSRQLFDLAKDISLAYHSEVRDVRQLQKCADRLNTASMDLRLQLGDNGFRGNLRDLLKHQPIKRAFTLLDDALELCYDVVKLCAGRSPLLDTVFERISHYRSRLKRLQDVGQPGFSYWYECSNRYFILALTPLVVADKFQQLITGKGGCWIFTSATLSVNQQLSHFTSRMGIAEAKTLLLSSPFDYTRQALLCVPRGLPPPGQRQAAQALAQMLSPLIEINQGRCFMLCTSHMMMRELAQQFRQLLEFPVLLQGETSKGRLLEQFISAGNALLVATSSFWEGVDVRGEALSLVIIDKLPFSSPDDPLLQARIEDCRLRGIDPFAQIQLPEAVIALKQGAGRLIRDVEDRGVLVICDDRLVTRPYGEVFLASLPPAPRTRDINQALAFLAAEQKS